MKDKINEGKRSKPARQLLKRFMTFEYQNEDGDPEAKAAKGLRKWLQKQEGPAVEGASEPRFLGAEGIRIDVCKATGFKKEKSPVRRAEIPTYK